MDPIQASVCGSLLLKHAAAATLQARFAADQLAYLLATAEHLPAAGRSIFSQAQAAYVELIKYCDDARAQLRPGFQDPDWLPFPPQAQAARAIHGRPYYIREAPALRDRSPIAASLTAETERSFFEDGNGKGSRRVAKDGRTLTFASLDCFS